jgi:hypothetical protein
MIEKIFQSLILLGIVFFISCMTNQNQEAQKDDLLNSRKKQNECYQKLIGKWTTYESDFGNGKKICKGRPCGISGYMEFLLTNDKLEGKKFLGISSELKPPNNTKWAEIFVNIEDENIVISFSSSVGCKTLYKVFELENDKLFGKFESKDCIINGKKIDLQGDFSAVKIID